MIWVPLFLQKEMEKLRARYQRGCGGWWPRYNQASQPATAGSPFFTRKRVRYVGGHCSWRCWCCCCCCGPEVHAKESRPEKAHYKSNPRPPKKKFQKKKKKKNTQRDQKGRKAHSHESINWESVRSISGKCSFFFPFSTNCPSYHEEREICRDFFFFFFFFFSSSRVPEVAPNLAERQTISMGLPNYFDFFARFEICLPIEWNEADAEEKLLGNLVLLLSWCIARSLDRSLATPWTARTAAKYGGCCGSWLPLVVSVVGWVVVFCLWGRANFGCQSIQF